MVHKIIFGLLTLIVMSIPAAMAQNKPSQDAMISNQFDQVLTGLKKINLTKTGEVKKVAIAFSSDDIIEQFITLLNAEIQRRKKEIKQKKKEYIPQESPWQQRIDKDLMPLLAGVREPITSLPQAKKAMTGNPEDNQYYQYIENIKRYQEQLGDEIKRAASSVQMNPETAKRDAMLKADKAMAAMNNNAVIQAMGGMEKLKNMRPEERKALAAKMAKNPMAYTTQESDPKKAFTRKMMTDATYAAKYNNMNNEQKQEQYDIFLNENGFVNKDTQASKDKISNERNEAAMQIAIDKRLAIILEHMQELANIVGPLQKNTDEYFAGVDKKMADEYANRVKALPLIDHGEAGKSRDTYPVDLAYNILIYPVAQQQALSNKELWIGYLEVLKVTIAEYNEFLNEYWGKSKAIDKTLIQRNQTPACILVGMCKGIIQLTELAKLQTNQNATKQRTYDEKVLQLYE